MNPIDWATTLVATLCGSEYYGEVTIQMVKGEITLIRLGQTLKPPRKSWREMTGPEYIESKRRY